MTAPVIYMYPGACSRVTMTALEQIGIAYELYPVDLAANAQNGGDYLAVTRKGKVPSLLVEGKIMTENAAILSFLDRSYPAAALLPRSPDPVADNAGLIDLVWCAATLHPMVRQLRNPQRWTTGETAGVKADGQVKFAVECAYISQRLAHGAWWYGTRWSIVDTYLYWAYSTAAKGDFPLYDYPDLLAHAARERARPAFQRMLAKEVGIVASERLSLDPKDL